MEGTSGDEDCDVGVECCDSSSKGAESLADGEVNCMSQLLEQQEMSPHLMVTLPRYCMHKRGRPHSTLTVHLAGVSWFTGYYHTHLIAGMTACLLLVIHKVIHGCILRTLLYEFGVNAPPPPLPLPLLLPLPICNECSTQGCGCTLRILQYC